MRLSLVLGIGFLSLVGSSPILADSGFRCKSGRLVSVGDSMKDVRDRCGDPDLASSRMERRRIKHRVSRFVGNVEESIVEEIEIEVPIDEWTYDLGPNAFTRYVLFQDGKVTNVATGDYGKR